MEKSVNLQIVDTKQLIMKNISDSKLPAMICSMLLHEIISDVDGQTNRLLTEERKQYTDSLKIKEESALKK